MLTRKCHLKNSLNRMKTRLRSAQYRQSNVYRHWNDNYQHAQRRMRDYRMSCAILNLCPRSTFPKLRLNVLIVLI